MKKLPVEIQENLHFLCVEVDTQVSTLERYFQTPSAALARRIRDRAGYADNLKTRIHTATANRLIKGLKRDADKFVLRCIEIVATELEWIAEVCRKCVAQSELLDNTDFLIPKAFIAILKKVRKAIKLVMPAILKRQSDIAIDIEHLYQDLDTMHARLMKRYLAELKKQNQIKQVTIAMFVAHELKHFNESLLRISETIISANLGQPVNFERYYSLQSLAENVDTDDDISITPIAETRSGSAISGLSNAEDAEPLAIYKDGQREKLKEEKDGVNSWHDIYPGLAPKILSYQKSGESASLLIEHLPGYTFESIIVNEDQVLIQKALKQLSKTLTSVWTETRNKKVYPAHFMQQMKKRLPEVYKIHPEFNTGGLDLCGLAIISMRDLVEQTEKIEKRYLPTFSVYIHGDFNVDNIIFDPIDKRINFIDLHRSCYMDYVQDVSIFMVSNYRLQITDSARRKQIMAAAISVYKLAKRFAKQHNDDTFELRLALGLARAFATSTRFILDKSLATRMFLRARYLLELITEFNKSKKQRFAVPVKEIFVE